ncbi:MAG TPA: four helix bundle protein [Saprospiraceae bacterium]|nr:four helix bundle protein [Saprospiraceae bacterium]
MQIENFLQDDAESYNRIFSARTKRLAIDIIKLCKQYCSSEELRIIGKQLIRSATSVAANYRASLRARSDAEKYAKLCIVVEESDETLFWLEVLQEGALIEEKILLPFLREATEIVKVMSVYRKKYQPA